MERPESFSVGQMVLVSLPEIKDALGTVTKDFPFYEVVLLIDHEPGAATDPVRCVSGEELRLATREEIVAKFREWEIEHGHKLDNVDNVIKKSKEILSTPSGFYLGIKM